MVHSTQQTDQGAHLQDPDADLIAALRASELAATGGWEAGSGVSSGVDVAGRVADASMTADERERVFMIREAGFWDLTEDVVVQLLRSNGGNTERALNALIDDDLGDLADVVHAQLSSGQPSPPNVQDASSAAGVVDGAAGKGNGGTWRGASFDRASDDASSNKSPAQQREDKRLERAALAALGLDDSDEDDFESQEQRFPIATGVQTIAGDTGGQSSAPCRQSQVTEEEDEEKEMLSMLLGNK